MDTKEETTATAAAAVHPKDAKAYMPKGTKTEWNSEPLKILKKFKVLSRNWTYDFKKDRKNIFYDKILKF